MSKSNQNTNWTLYNCPFEHGNECKQEWINKYVNHIIVCKCKKCNHKKNMVLDGPDKSSNTHCSNHILNPAIEAE